MGWACSGPANSDPAKGGLLGETPTKSDARDHPGANGLFERLKNNRYVGMLLGLMSASMIILISSNFVNAGNLLFNLIFSRALGPALFSDLALILTLMLSIMGVLNATQMQVTEEVAHLGEERRGLYVLAQARLMRRLLLIGAVLVPIFMLFVLRIDLADMLGLSSPYLLPIFILGMPFFIPLAIWRGVAQGRLDLWRIVASANTEMLIRLLGALLLWWLGFGVEGAVFAIALSILTAWVFARPPRGKRGMIALESQPKSAEGFRTRELFNLRNIWPWAAIQLAIVLGLDGDVFIAKALLGAHDAGLIAALSLIQRIIFFASFALASILLPQVIAEVKEGRTGFFKLLEALGATLLTSVPVILIAAFWPELLARLLFGEEFIAISEVLLRVAFGASFATISYLFVTFALAHGVRHVALIYLGLIMMQLVALDLFAIHFGASLQGFTLIKLIAQGLILLLTSVYVGGILWRARKGP